MKYDVAAFGEILIDFTWCGTNESGVALFAQNPGGAPGNVCVAVQRLGGAAAFLGKVGDDMHGQLLIDTLNKEGVSTKGMVKDDTVFTTLAFVSVGENGERSFSFARKPGADTQMRFEEMDLEEIENARIFHVGSLSLTHEPARDTTLKALKRAREAGCILSYDPNYRASLWSDESTAIQAMRSLTPLVDIMKISDEETALLTGYSDPQKALESLLEQGVKVAAVTLGSEGALIGNREGTVLVPGFRPEVIADTNGAGDSFWGAILFQLSQSGKKPEDLSLADIENFARFANMTASLTVSKPGAIPAMPQGKTVQEKLNSL